MSKFIIFIKEHIELIFLVTSVLVIQLVISSAADTEIVYEMPIEDSMDIEINYTDNNFQLIFDQTLLRLFSLNAPCSHTFIIDDTIFYEITMQNAELYLKSRNKEIENLLIYYSKIIATIWNQSNFSYITAEIILTDPNDSEVYLASAINGELIYSIYK